MNEVFNLNVHYSQKDYPFLYPYLNVTSMHLKLELSRRWHSSDHEMDIGEAGVILSRHAVKIAYHVYTRDDQLKYNNDNYKLYKWRIEYEREFSNCKFCNCRLLSPIFKSIGSKVRRLAQIDNIRGYFMNFSILVQLYLHVYKVDLPYMRSAFYKEHVYFTGIKW